MQSPIHFTLRSKAFIPSGMKSSLYPIFFKIERITLILFRIPNSSNRLASYGHKNGHIHFLRIHVN